MPQTLLHNAGVLTMDGPGQLFFDGAVLIEGKTIKAVGKSAEVAALAAPEAEKIDLRGKWILAGLINARVGIKLPQRFPTVA